MAEKLDQFKTEFPDAAKADRYSIRLKPFSYYGLPAYVFEALNGATFLAREFKNQDEPSRSVGSGQFVRNPNRTFVVPRQQMLDYLLKKDKRAYDWHVENTFGKEFVFDEDQVELID